MLLVRASGAGGGGAAAALARAPRLRDPVQKQLVSCPLSLFSILCLPSVLKVLSTPPQTLIRALLPYFSWGGLNLNTPLGASCLSSTLDLTLAHPGQRPARAAKHHRHDPRRGPMPRVNKRAQLAETATALGQAKLSFGGCLSIERPSRPTAPKTTATSTPATAVAERCAEVDEVPLMHCPQCRFRTASAIPCAALYTGGLNLNTRPVPY